MHKGISATISNNYFLSQRLKSGRIDFISPSDNRALLIDHILTKKMHQGCQWGKLDIKAGYQSITRNSIQFD